MNTIKRIFARFLIVCWLGVILGTIGLGLDGNFSFELLGGGSGFGLFVLAIQFIFYGFLNPLKLIEVGVVDN